jgi:hypothetical protein
MMRLIMCAAISAVMSLLAGCKFESTFESSKPVTFVIQPGAQFMVLDNPAVVDGFDGCYQSKRISTLNTSDGPHYGCIVVRPDAQTVQVRVGRNNATTTETWTVVRSNNETKFRRPEGDFATYKTRGPIEVFRANLD